MPGMTGIDIYIKAKKSDPEIKDRLLFFSATINSKIIDFFEEHDLHHIRKPLSVNQIRGMMGKKSSIVRGASLASVGGSPSGLPVWNEQGETSSGKRNTLTKPFPIHKMIPAIYVVRTV